MKQLHGDSQACTWLSITGLALTWFCVFCLAYSFVFTPPNAFTPIQVNASRVLYIGGIALMQIILYILAPRMVSKEFRIPLATIAFILAFAAPGSLISPLGTIRIGAWPVVLSLPLAGMWQGAMHCLWSERISFLSEDRRYVAFHAGTIIGALLFTAVALLARSPTPYFVAAALVLVFALYVVVAKKWPTPIQTMSHRTVSRKLSKGMRKSTIILFAFGAVFGMGIYSCMDTDAVDIYTSYATIGLAIALGGAVLLFSDRVLNRRYKIEEITLALAPALAILLILLSLSTGLATWLVFLLMLAVLTVFDNSAFCFQFNVLDELGLNPFVGIARGRMCVQTGMFIAALANFLFIYLNAQPLNMPLIVPLVMVVVLFVMMTSVSRIDLIPKQFVDLPATPLANGIQGDAEAQPAEAKPFDVVAKIAEDYDLSSREAEVLELIIAGNSTPAIAEKLFISQNTVKSHRYHIFRKMTVESKQEIINIRDQYVERYKNL